jgi:hypothetical protein
VKLKINGIQFEMVINDEEWLVGGGLAPCNFMTFQKQLGMESNVIIPTD